MYSLLKGHVLLSHAVIFSPFLHFDLQFFFVFYLSEGLRLSSEKSQTGQFFCFFFAQQMKWQRMGERKFSVCLLYVLHNIKFSHSKYNSQYTL